LRVVRSTKHELVKKPPTQPDHNAYKEVGEVVAHIGIIAVENRPLHKHALFLRLFTGMMSVMESGC